MPRRKRSRRYEGPKVYTRPETDIKWVRFTINGRLIRRPTGTAVPAKAEKRASEIWAEENAAAGRVAPGLNGEEPPLDQLIAQYLAWRELQGKGSVRYLETLEHNLRLHLLAHFDHISELTPATWEVAVANMRFARCRCVPPCASLKDDQGKPKTCERPRGLTWATICRQTSAANGALRWAAKQGLVDQPQLLPFPERKAVAREQKRRRPLTTDERDKILAELEDEARRWYTVAFYTAMRKSEIEQLCLRWIDWKESAIAIPAGAQKSADERDEAPIDMPPEAARAIKEQMAAKGIIDPGAPIFGSTEHVKAFWGALARAGVDAEGVTARHVTKHTRLTQLGAAGGQTALLAVMYQGRHKDPKTSMKYVKPGLEHVRAAREAADRSKTRNGRRQPR